MAKTGNVYYGEILAGYISETDEGYSYQYDASYLQRADARPVSLTLPLQEAPYPSTVLFSFFDGLIPEGWLLNLVTDTWKIKSNDRFELLLAACRDTIGAVTVQPTSLQNSY